MTRDVATGERKDALDRHPRGIVVYTPERVTFLIVKDDRIRPERLPPPDEEKIALFDSMFAYSGSYTVESDRVIHHVDISWNEAWSGTDQVAVLQCRRRYAELHFAPCPKSVRRARDRPRSDVCAREATRRVGFARLDRRA